MINILCAKQTPATFYLLPFIKQLLPFVSTGQSVIQSQKAVIAYFYSKQLLPLVSSEQYKSASQRALEALLSPSWH